MTVCPTSMQVEARWSSSSMRRDWIWGPISKQEVIYNWYKLTKQKDRFLPVECHWVYQLYSSVDSMYRGSWPIQNSLNGTFVDLFHFTLFSFFFFFILLVFCLSPFNGVGHGGIGFFFWKWGSGGWRIRSWKLPLDAYCLRLENSIFKKRWFGRLERLVLHKQHLSSLHCTYMKRWVWLCACNSNAGNGETGESLKLNTAQPA